MADTSLTLLDHIISQHGYKTVEFEKLPSILERIKNKPPPTTPELQRDIRYLWYEVAFHKEQQESLMKMFNDIQDVY